jgi:rhodanese-related sulfurtransferase/DNA-binding transcriptional ArsR family regulator
LSNQSPKSRLFEQFAIVAKALGHANRLELLELLAQGERSVEALAIVAGLSIANTSRHLQHLRLAGLVGSRKEGLYVYYSVAGDDVIDLLGTLRRTSERHIGEVNRVVAGYFNERDTLEPVSRAELRERSKNGLVTVLDVRPTEEYEFGHIPGAINMPLEDIEKCIKDLPVGQEVIAYCRGPYCVLAFEAVAKLRERGFGARRLEDGYPEWKAAGLPVERDRETP